MADSIDSFEAFWPYYVRAHQNPTSRVLHAIGTSLGVTTALAAVLTRRARLVPLALVLGYGPAWVGHFVFEGNRPATFGHPLWSLRGDFKMLSLMLRGEMEAELARVNAAAAQAEASSVSASADSPETPADSDHNIN